MDRPDLSKYLSNLHLGDIRFFQQIPSTNDEAANWIKEGCPDLALVVADEQTAGRGRGGRRWFTAPGSALAFSLVFRPDEAITQMLELGNSARLNGLGALAVCLTLQNKYGLEAKIKWPNDILVVGKKISGVLVEMHWAGNELAGVVLGIGINVATTSLPPDNWDVNNPSPIPATCVEAQTGLLVNRWNLLKTVLEVVLTWRKLLSGPEFLQTWQDNLAFMGEWVRIISPGKNDTQKLGQITGLKVDGALQIKEESGELVSLRTGEIHPLDLSTDEFRLRPVDS